MATIPDHVSARERRGDERHAMRGSATIRAYRLPTVTAALLDISAGGAMLEADARDYGSGEEIVLTAGEVQIVATIAWLNDPFFGVAFHRRLDTRELGLLRAKGRA